MGQSHNQCVLFTLRVQELTNPLIEHDLDVEIERIASTLLRVYLNLFGRLINHRRDD